MVWRSRSAVVAVLVAVLALGFGVPSASADGGPEGAAYGWGWDWTLGPGGTLTNDDSTADPVAAAVRAGGDDTYVQLSMGDQTACGLTALGGAYCWGRNNVGQLGNGTTTASTSPVAVLNGANSSGEWASLDAGGKHNCGLAPDGSAYCWGEGNIGRLGDGSWSNSTSPAAVANGDNTSGTWKQISAGGYISCGVGGDDSVYCWGAGSAGGLGNGATSDQATPVRVLGGPYVSVSAGRQHACAVTIDFTVECWGINTYGQLGDGATTNSASPVTVQLPSGAQAWQVHAGDLVTCALMTDQRIMCWGDNTHGELGQGSMGGFSATPVYINDWRQWRGLSVGSLTVCGIERDNQQAFCWGYNGSGQVGDGTFEDRAGPTQVVTSGVLNGLKVAGITTGTRIDGGYLNTGTLVLGRSSGDGLLDSTKKIEIGAVTPGSSGVGSLTFTAAGGLPFQVSTPLFRVVGPHADTFAITGDTCSGQIVNPGDTCVVTVTGSPESTGPIIARLLPNPGTVVSGDVIDISVTGARTAPVYPTRTWYVAQSGTPNLGSGTSCADPDAVGSDDTAIRTVFDLVSADDTVQLCAGTYTVTSTLTVDDSIVIQGESATSTALNGGGDVQIMRVLDYGVNSSTVVEPEVLVRDLTFVEGAAGSAFVSSDEDCSLWPRCGGAIYVEDGSSLTVADSEFLNNQATFSGGAIATTGGNDYDGGVISVRNSTFYVNLAGIDAGAIGISFNFKGGAPYHSIEQSTFVDNLAFGRSGGAVGLSFADARIDSSTFLDNAAGYEGDALYGDLTVTGSLLASSTAGDLCHSGVSANATNVASDGSCDVSATAYADLKIDGFGMWGGATRTVWIGAGSAVDDANTGTCEALDQRGATRTASPCDAGAVERRSATAQVVTADLSYPATATVGSAALPLTSPAVGVPAPSPTYATSSAACSVNTGTGEVTGVAAGVCDVTWRIFPTVTQDGASGDDSLVIVKQAQPTLTVIAPSTAPIDSTTALSTSGGAGSGSVTYSTGSSTVCSVTGSTLTFGSSAGTCTVTATKDADAAYLATTSSAVTIAVIDPTPAPTRPPSAPALPGGQDAAVPGDGRATLRWEQPTSQGSFPITQYQVVADPGGRTCLVPATQTSCVIDGLTNGTTYQLRVRALNGSGWSAWSTPVEVTPRGLGSIGDPPAPAIAVTARGSRNKGVVRVVALVEGAPASSALLMVKLPGAAGYSPLELKPFRTTSDRIVWKWQTSKRVFAYAVVADTRSDRVVVTRWRR